MIGGQGDVPAEDILWEGFDLHAARTEIYKTVFVQIIVQRHEKTPGRLSRPGDDVFPTRPRKGLNLGRNAAAHGRLGQRANPPVYDLPILNNHHSWDAANIKSLRRIWIL